MVEKDYTCFHTFAVKGNFDGPSWKMRLAFFSCMLGHVHGCYLFNSEGAFLVTPDDQKRLLTGIIKEANLFYCKLKMTKPSANVTSTDLHETIIGQSIKYVENM